MFYISPKDIISLNSFSHILDLNNKNTIFEILKRTPLSSIPTYAVNYRNSTGASTHSTPSKRFFAAAGEAVERNAFQLSKPYFKSLSYNEIQKLGLPAFNPLNFTAYFKEQKTYQNGEVQNIDCDKQIDWSWFEDATNYNKKILLPHVFNSYCILKKPFTFIGSSSGNGCGQSETEAKLSAVLELIERDAIMFYWWTQTTPVQIDISSHNKDLFSIFGGNLDYKKKICFFLLKTDLQNTVVLSTFRGDPSKGEPHFSMAAGAHLSPKVALEKSFFELIQFIKHIMDSPPITASYHYDYDQSVLTFLDHAYLYAKDPMNRAYGFLFKKNKMKIKLSDLVNYNSSDASKNLRHIIKDFKINKYSLYFSNHTTRDLYQANLHVMRAFSPHLAHIDFIHRYRALACERYRALSKKMGLKKHFTTFSDFNKYPHPFP